VVKENYQLAILLYKFTVFWGAVRLHKKDLYNPKKEKCAGD